jgi:hypothetical protein
VLTLFDDRNVMSCFGALLMATSLLRVIKAVPTKIIQIIQIENRPAEDD